MLRLNNIEVIYRDVILVQVQFGLNAFFHPGNPQTIKHGVAEH
jgi:hypothetical protein